MPVEPDVTKFCGICCSNLVFDGTFLPVFACMLSMYFPRTFCLQFSATYGILRQLELIALCDCFMVMALCMLQDKQINLMHGLA